MGEYKESGIYSERLEELRKVFSDGLSQYLYNYFTYYTRFPRIPRKLKKRMKRANFWNCLQSVKKNGLGEINITWKPIESIESIDTKVEIVERFTNEIRNDFLSTCNIPKEIM